MWLKCPSEMVSSEFHLGNWYWAIQINLICWQPDLFSFSLSDSKTICPFHAISVSLVNPSVDKMIVATWLFCNTNDHVFLHHIYVNPTMSISPVRALWIVLNRLWFYVCLWIWACGLNLCLVQSDLFILSRRSNPLQVK